MRKLSAEDVRGDLLMLEEYEAEGGPSLRELARREGQSHVNILKRLRRSWAYRERWRAEERLADAGSVVDGHPGDEDDIPHVAISGDPDRERGDWYEPESGACSVESGRIRIGDHNGRRLLVRSVNGGAPVDPGERKHHKPDPDGLKGGKG